MYQLINYPGSLEEFLLKWIDKEFLVKAESISGKKLVFFHNGDKMTVNLPDQMMDWKPCKPGEMFNSKLSLRFHQWFGKGFLRMLSPAEETMVKIYNNKYYTEKGSVITKKAEEILRRGDDAGLSMDECINMIQAEDPDLYELLKYVDTDFDSMYKMMKVVKQFEKSKEE